MEEAMSEYPYQQFPSQFPGQFQPPKRKRHWLRWTLLAVLVAAVAGGAGTAASGGKKHAATVSPATSAAPAVHTAPSSTSEQAPPPAVPDPAGTVKGTCAYELNTDTSNYEAHAADMNAEVDAENTGNVGIVLAITITYPQLGHSPVSMAKTVKVPYGKTLTVPFSKPMTQSQITRLQDWQTGHDYDDGCTYKATITDTYGPAH